MIKRQVGQKVPVFKATAGDSEQLMRNAPAIMPDVVINSTPHRYTMADAFYAEINAILQQTFIELSFKRVAG
jgi:hypothetical protein